MDANGTHTNGHSGTEEQRSTAARASNRTRAQTSDYRPTYERPTRQPASERENAFNKLAWALEGAAGVMEELLHNDLGLSEEFWTHAYAARREGLLALRAVLDEFIEKSSGEDARETERQQRRERRGGIDIDF